MDYQLPEELRMLQETVRRFVDRELIPIENDSLDGPKLKADLQVDLEEKAKAIDLWLYDVPEQYGGQGLGLGVWCHASLSLNNYSVGGELRIESHVTT